MYLQWGISYAFSCWLIRVLGLLVVDWCCSYSVKDKEEGEGAQGKRIEYDTRSSGEVRVLLRFRFRKHEESQVQGVQREVEVFKQVSKLNGFWLKLKQLHFLILFRQCVFLMSNWSILLYVASDSFNFCFRFFLGSNKVMQVALGRSVSDEIRPGLHKISKVAGCHAIFFEFFLCSYLVRRVDLYDRILQFPYCCSPYCSFFVGILDSF